MSGGNENGWFAVQGHLVGNLEKWGTCWDWDRRTYTTKSQAIAEGFKAFGSDDFNVGHLTNGVLDWFGWMDDKHPDEDYAEVAEELGLEVEWA